MSTGGQFGMPPDRTGAASASVGELVSGVAADMSTLMRQELELAKAEVKAEAAKAGKGAGMLGGAALGGYFALLFASVALMYLINLAIPLGWAALVVAVLWAVIAAVLAVQGRTTLKNVSPAPTQTAETLKEDVQWAKARTR